MQSIKSSIDSYSRSENNLSRKALLISGRKNGRNGTYAIYKDKEYEVSRIDAGDIN